MKWSEAFDGWSKTDIAELVTPERILAADLQIHPVCFLEYMHKWTEATQRKIHNEKISDFYFVY